MKRTTIRLVILLRKDQNSSIRKFWLETSDFSIWWKTEKWIDSKTRRNGV